MNNQSHCYSNYCYFSFSNLSYCYFSYYYSSYHTKLDCMYVVYDSNAPIPKMAEEPVAKRLRLGPPFTLLYHGSIPGRGEFVRLVLEAANVAYTDAGNDPELRAEVYKACAPTVSMDNDYNPPPFCPPMLRVAGAGKEGGALLISQTATIMLYLGERLKLAGGDAVDRLHVHSMALTALDLCDEAHDTHHPTATSRAYEDQKPEALKRAADFREARLPKFLHYFERVLESNGEQTYEHLVGGTLTYADTTLWQVVDGLFHAFPREMEARKEEFPWTLCEFYEAVKEQPRIKAYLASERRLKYSHGVFRHYPELDRPELAGEETGAGDEAVKSHG